MICMDYILKAVDGTTFDLRLSEHDEDRLKVDNGLFMATKDGIEYLVPRSAMLWISKSATAHAGLVKRE
jgi:hypothetical protein